jgi:hypothetical protein
MRSKQFLTLLVGALLVAVPVRSQNVNMGHPQEIHVQHHPSPEEIRDRLNGPQLQKDAKELAEICALVGADMDGVKQGILSKDVLEKLKRMEKLSKRVRKSWPSPRRRAKDHDNKKAPPVLPSSISAERHPKQHGHPRRGQFALNSAPCKSSCRRFARNRAQHGDVLA